MCVCVCVCVCVRERERESVCESVCVVACVREIIFILSRCLHTIHGLQNHCSSCKIKLA